MHQTTKVPLLGDIPVLGALFRSTIDTVEKDNLVLVLTPHIIRNEDDMRHIFEVRMQERQEFLDHYFVFRDGPPIGFDPARGHGLLASLRESYGEVAERRRLESQVPQTVVTAPIHGPRSTCRRRPSAWPRRRRRPGQPRPARRATPLPAGRAPLHVAPPQRTIERIER